MADLIEKFFRSELTEKEDGTLSELLGSSEEAAEKFARQAEKHYFALGLPDPGVGAHGSPKWGWGHFGKLLTVVSVVGGAVWYWYQSKVEAPVAPISLRIETPVVSPAIQPEPTKKAKMKSEKKEALSLVPPPHLDGTDYRNLKVLVNQEVDGPVTVHVLDPEGKEVRLLYAGPLKAGNWSFEWDGRLEKGQPAVPGVYRLQVQNGSETLEQELSIRNSRVR